MGSPREIGIVLIAHGSRRAEANADLHDLVTAFRQQGRGRTFAAFLELAEPGIVEAGEQAVLAGATTIVLSPYFLSAGIHVAEDLEEARQELARRHPSLEFKLAAPLGPHPLLQQILSERISEACELTG